MVERAVRRRAGHRPAGPAHHVGVRERATTGKLSAEDRALVDDALWRSARSFPPRAGTPHRLQLIGGTQVHGPVRGAGTIAFSAARISLPTASP